MYASIGFFLIALAWLVPNTSQPWIAFWTEAVACVGLLFVAHSFFWKKQLPLPHTSFAWICTVLALLFIDWILRKNSFFGDYIAGYIYISSFFIAMLTGMHIKKYNVFFICISAVCVISCGIAAAQWLQLDLNRLYFKEISPQERPFANSGQPNHLGTFLSFGIISTAILFSNQKISKTITFILLITISFGAALTQSRTTLLQIFIFSGVTLYLSYKNKIEISKILCITPLLFSLLFTSTLPILSELIGITQSRFIHESGIKTSRTDHWISMLDAVGAHPWLGYGWLHSADAHINGTNFSIKESIFQYSHNIILDLFLWFGIPAAILAIIPFIKDLHITLIRCKTSTNYLALLGFILFIVHCLLEYPFAYLHLTIIGGVLYGISKESFEQPSASHAKWIPQSILLITTIFSISFLFDYLKIEPTTTALRFKYAKIGLNQTPTEIPKIFVATQAEAYILSSYIAPSEHISSTDMLAYQLAATRYGTQRLLFHSAMAYAFMGEKSSSQETLKNICKIHSEAACIFSKSEWSRYQIEYPKTIGIIEFPS